jgi:hypothetical protein
MVVNGQNTHPMPALRIITFILLVAVFGGCDKDITPVSADCNEFKSALFQGDKEKVRGIINRFIVQSSSLTHTADNLEKLATYISRSCDVKASIGCFACIKTLPEMSEIIVRFHQDAHEETRVIDLSTGDNDDKMIFISLHQ